MALGDTWR